MISPSISSNKCGGFGYGFTLNIYRATFGNFASILRGETNRSLESAGGYVIALVVFAGLQCAAANIIKRCRLRIDDMFLIL